MSRFNLVRHLVSSTVLGGGGGGGSGTITYDTRFGTDAVTAAATGWFTFGLHSGNRRIWIDSLNGNDANNGLTAATAVKTPSRLFTVFTTGWTSGDQIMVAGGQSQTYADPNNLSVSWLNYPGISATYPTVVMCYDSTDPSNAAKYGKLLGSQKPRWLCTTTNGHTFFDLVIENGGVSNYAIQGIDFDSQGTPDVSFNVVGRHDNIAYQNLRSNGMGFGSNNNSSGLGHSQNMSITKCSGWNAWSAVNGNNSFLFSAQNDGLWFQDNVIIHSGWPVGSSRDDGIPNGGASFLGHGVYYSAHSSLGVRFDRNVYIDCECDGWGIRGDAAATQLFSMDNASPEAISGYSGSYTEQPLGSTITINDFVICGAARELNASTQQWGGGFASANLSTSGTLVNNGVMFDNPWAANSTLYQQNLSSEAGQVAGSITISNLRVHNYALNHAYDYNPQGGNTSTATYSNCLLDSLAKFTSHVSAGSLGGTNRLWTGADYPNASFDRAALIAALGFANKAQMVNAMLAFPHLPWAQACLGLVFPAFGATPIYPTASVPSIAGLPTPETVYRTALANLTTSNIFTRVTPKTISSITISSGVATVTTATAHGLSTGQGVSITGTANTGGGNYSTDAFGVKGVVFITVTGATTFTYVPPDTPGSNATSVGSYIQGLLLQGTGANSTFSATGLEAGMTLTGRTITYNGTGSGAFSTINVTETSEDGLGSHTTTALVIG